MPLYLVQLLRQAYRGNEDIELKRRGSGGRGELISRKEGMEYRKGENLKYGKKRIESVIHHLFSWEHLHQYVRSDGSVNVVSKWHVVGGFHKQT